MELIERIAMSHAPSRELDAAIARAVVGNPTAHWFQDHLGTHRTDDTVPAYSASIDAALTLVGGEAGLGSLIAGVFPDGKRGWVARVRVPATADGEGATPPLAIIAAYFAALRTILEGQDHE